MSQATEAVRAIPNILSLRYTDSKKPDIAYYIQELQVPVDLTIRAERNLEKYLIGADQSDIWAYSYLNKIGVSWNQLRILLDAFPTLTCIEKSSNWELRNRKLTRETLNEFALIFLRKRLQIGTREIYLMLKVRNVN